MRATLVPILRRCILLQIGRTVRDRCGFSILELLVCISIICVLAALLFTVFGKSKAKSLESVSASNLKQYHLALSLYASDYGAMPIGRPYDPEITRYLGGKWIEPPLATPLRLRKRKNDTTYRIHAFRDSPGFPKLLQECFDSRGGQIPIVSDGNWTSPQQIAFTHGGFYLYVRMDGSIGREPFNIHDRLERHPEQFPCPGTTNWANFR